MNKQEYIQLLREADFNCFPLPQNKKIADFRYKAHRTVLNQNITNEENFGYIPISGAGTAIIDLDNKERYKTFAANMIKEGYMVIETGRGWHIPVCGLSGNISKMELFDYKFSPVKIVEVQGPDHYCVGPCSVIFHEKLKQSITYENKGSEKIWDAKQKDFHDFIDGLCKVLNVEGKKKTNRSSYKYLRERFEKGLLPTKGTSNDYFFQAAIWCNTENLSLEECKEKIEKIYEEWSHSNIFSDRLWSNVQTKINEVYEKDIQIGKGRPKASKEIDRTEIALRIIKERRLYSNVYTHEIFENNNGFLEKINDTLKRSLVQSYPQMEQSDYHSVLFKIESLADLIPATNKKLIRFTNGAWNLEFQILQDIDDIDSIADMGFRDYEYLYDSPENIPTKFIGLMFDNVPKNEHPRVKKGLKAILTNYLDPKISVIQGEPGTGKSTPLLILVEILGDYAMAVELDQLLEDKFIRAKIIGKRLLVLQDLPQTWKDFSQLKTITGEQKKTERGFHSDSVMFENKLKIWASTNYLAKVPEKEKNAMFTRRLSLIHNVKGVAFKENATLLEEIVQEEGEKIISWILNISNDECKYEEPDTVREEWENLASPELKYLDEYWEVTDDATMKPSVIQLVKDLRHKIGVTITVEQMNKSLKARGFSVKWNIIQNISASPLSETVTRL